MGDPALTPRERFTYRHYKTWPDSERWELIEGHAWSMSPAPKSRHQELAGRLFRRIGNFLEGKTCRVFNAPFDVIPPEGDEPEDEVDTVVQPDIVVYCDRSKITEAGARGVPDLAMEILSPSTSKKDQNDKFNLYERHGVREYWVVDPADRWLCVYRLGANDKFDEGELRERLREYGPIESRVLEGFVVAPLELFAEME
jgi:Uma2 family endonuclease